MAKYILKRLVYSFLTIFLIVALTFFMMHALPGDPFSTGKAIDPQIMAALKEKYDLDKPVPQQFVKYCMNVLQGDLGTSLQYKRPVVDIIGESFPYSFELGVRALVFATVAGLLLGILAAVKRGTVWDSGSMLVAMLGVSMPSFIIGALLQFFLGLQLQKALGFSVFPITGWTTEMSKILPAFALGFGTLAIVSRLMRTSMLDVLNQDYIKTAKAKGLSHKKIIWRHAVRNAIMPIITIMGAQAAAILTGALVVEKLFSIPGMGKFFVTSINNNDFTMIAGTTIFYGVFLVAANLIVDILYCFIDPRVKLADGKEG